MNYFRNHTLRAITVPIPPFASVCRKRMDYYVATMYANPEAKCQPHDTSYTSEKGLEGVGATACASTEPWRM